MARTAGTDVTKNDSVWSSPGFTPTMIAVASAFGAWSILLPVLPLAVLDSGGTAALAGATTAVFMAVTVVTQMCTPFLLRKFGYNPVMVVAALMLGVPALGHLLGMDAWIVLLFSALRGIGFGAITVAESALIAELVPVRLLGKATGLLGVFVGLAQMLLLPSGLFLADHFNYETVYVVAAAIALVAGVMCLRIPRIKAASTKDDEAVAGGAPQVSMWKLVLVPALAVTTVSMSFGAVSTFLPAAVREIDPSTGAVIGGFMLSIVGASIMTARYVSGAIADRTGKPGQLMIISEIIALLGMVLMSVTVALHLSVWLLVVAAILFGSGFGAAQNEALLSMFHRLPRSKVSEASAVWNIFYDAGTGLGSIVYGAVVASYFYHGAFAVGAAVIVLGILWTAADAFVGRHRVSEYDNIKTRLRQVRVRARRPRSGE
ncbi:MFS transporter [Corynebacterium tapiri]|uniref:MFS transporter n=1 Tax=Corynebacterium tapiri TaxID=1448266 RepID=A0A5C4U5A1_9CORY|nr:MFS transporter [Corynebacterium tapiri]TNL99356.1 MFS transporter [Corynebacterium tapiri]